MKSDPLAHTIAHCACGATFCAFHLDDAIRHLNTDSMQSNTHRWLKVDPTVAFLISNDKVYPYPPRILRQ